MNAEYFQFKVLAFKIIMNIDHFCFFFCGKLLFIYCLGLKRVQSRKNNKRRFQHSAEIEFSQQWRRRFLLEARGRAPRVHRSHLKRNPQPKPSRSGLLGP
ncbi:unnamed protein product [Citrullus colocynthis]|uniref:Uncharacterized protein n=1 Tax=Citrullus colocynthis TaxID=252529 RepID=A0ABP0ZAW3_9ROSI